MARPMCSITLKCFTTEHVVTVIWAASVQRPLKVPHFEAGKCLWRWGQSTVVRFYEFMPQIVDSMTNNWKNSASTLWVASRKR